ncbi:ABC transporter substrate-binding protein [Dolichospermum lemmermannii CS-548]|uniref:ABC transporter substrate-binding protein n=1 Tax=Dolichospermum lemmermannii TaxID=54295 RepID=UPI00232B8BB1|nr:ABC transporter substrate-binding protein [Dolichospermum lemmermannii]MDB9438388.1 ABC transporter substrate-binding protein [Dolichospermum lemmermannii CS-548]
MKRRNFFSLPLVFFSSLLLTVSCNQAPQQTPNASSSLSNTPPIVIGYSNWAGWWPWAIAEAEGLFAKNGANVQMKWFDGYLESLQALAAGQLDGNSQTLNDTIAFAGDAVNGEVAVLVNDNSSGNDKIIVTEEMKTIQDLKGKKVAVEEGVVGDFLLSLALKKPGLRFESLWLKIPKKPMRLWPSARALAKKNWPYIKRERNFSP